MINEKYPDKNVDGIELAQRQNDEKLIDVSFYDNNNKFAAAQIKRVEKSKEVKKLSNKEQIFKRLQDSKRAQQKTVNPQQIKDKTLPNVKIPNKM